MMNSSTVTSSAKLGRLSEITEINPTMEPTISVKMTYSLQFPLYTEFSINKKQLPKFLNLGFIWNKMPKYILPYYYIDIYCFFN